MLKVTENPLGKVLKDLPEKGEYPCKAQGGYADREYCESFFKGKGCMYWDWEKKVCKLNEQDGDNDE